MPRHRTISKTFQIAKARSQASSTSSVQFGDSQSSSRIRPVKQHARGNLYINNNDYKARLALRKAQRKLAEERADPCARIMRRILRMMAQATKENEMEIDGRPTRRQRARPRRRPRPTAMDLLDERIRRLTLSDDDDVDYHRQSPPQTMHTQGTAYAYSHWPTSTAASHNTFPLQTPPLNSQASGSLREVGNSVYYNTYPPRTQHSGTAIATSPSWPIHSSDPALYNSSFASEGAVAIRNQTLRALHEHFARLIVLLGANSEVIQNALARFQSAIKLASPLAPLPTPSLSALISPELATYIQTIQNKPSSAAEDAYGTIARAANEIMYLFELLAQDISLFRYYQ